MAAPKGNKYSTGRKPYYDTPDALQEAIEEYFVFCEGEYHEEEQEVKDKKGKAKVVKVRVWDREARQPTITGLCLYLGFESRQSFYDYAENPSFSYTIKRARLIIESEYEQLLSTKAVTGAIFALKNMGWEDKTKQEHTGNNGAPLSLHVSVIEQGPPIASSEREISE